MTREEAILLSAYTGFLLVPDFSEVHKFCEDALGRPIFTHEFADRDVQKEIQEKLRPQIMELIQNIAALRGPTREMVEKVWRGCYTCDEYKYFMFNAWTNPESSERPDCMGTSLFCPQCGKPLTDEAVDMMLERWKEAVDGETD